mgnify:FL=1
MRERQKNLKGKESIFQIFLGNVENEPEKIKEQEPIRGKDIETEINVSLEEAYFGTEKKIALKDVNGRSKVFSINIPKGIRNGEKIRLIGQGKDGANGGKSGDLYIKIDIQNSKNFRLNGMDIYTDLLITPWEASLGTRVNVQTIDSENKIYIPQGIQSGEKLRISNKGYDDGNGNRGDLVAEIKIVVPKKISEQEKELYEKLEQISKFNPREEK